MHTVRKCFLEADLGENGYSSAVNEASDIIMAIFNLCENIELSCYADSIIKIDDYFTTHHNFESATTVLPLRNTKQEEKEKEDEED